MMNNVLEIVKNPALTQDQKSISLAREAENSLEVLGLDVKEKSYLNFGVICDLGEGNAPFKPRYNLVDFELFMKKGSEFLQLEPPGNLLEAVNNLLILYKHIPSVTNYPVYLGDIDKLLEPYIEDENEAYNIIKLFLIHIDRTLTDAFVHANIGPEATRAGRLILRAERELANPVPNLTLKYSKNITPDDFALEAVKTALEVSKPYFANHEMICQDFGKKYGICSCYNSLPVGGGSYTLVRFNLKTLAQTAEGRKHFLNTLLPETVKVMCSIMDKRIKFLVEESGFFQGDFLVKEGLLNQDRYTAMFGIYGLAEAVNHIMKIENINQKYGRSDQANELGVEIVKVINKEVNKHQNKYCNISDNRFLLHAQSGITSDLETTPGCRIPTGDEPALNEHLIQAGTFHSFFPTGISDIFPFEKTYKNNLEAILDIAKGAMASGLRMFTFYTADNDLVRITGYLVKRSEIKKLARGNQVLRDTTAFGLEAEQNGHLTGRRVR